MNHFAHPEFLSPGKKADLRYGRFAIEELIRAFRDVTGEIPARWTAKLVGGAHENAGFRKTFDIGNANVEVAREVLSQHGIKIVGEDIGGSRGRKVLFHSASNRLRVAELRNNPTAPTPPKFPGFPITPQFPGSPAAPASVSTATIARKKRVMVVDDSRTVRDLLKQLLSKDPGLEIVGYAADAFEAAKLLPQLKPDVMTLDVNMPGKSGVDWLQEFFPTQPIPVVMLSSMELREGNDIFRALEIGAVDYLQKPSFDDLKSIGPLICERIKVAAQAKLIKTANLARVKPSQTSTPIDLRKVLAIGASTGGTEALKLVLTMLPKRIPPTLIVQHIPPIFSKAFADRLNEICPFEVKEAEDGDELKESRVLIAPGGKQMKIRQKASGIFVQITDEDPVNRHKPSVDYLFDSVAAIYGRNSVGVVLTGMGSDGAKGLLKMRSLGAKTIAQNEETCVVFGMPKEAIKLEAVQSVLPLNGIAQGIINFLARSSD